ncbi:CoA transferase [Actinokineospora bangkokensis]|uniref:Carnitine dehydratase n=1 Tax=Actinokineospora bangkokensis TaxID=1193682 RepID=A0A1Q9LSG7_9PSEU|nr:CoA transferase [Actinokineospora bangkokensis]OLR94975.1 carnitine dehydratase [Actinokineospora bangkokensis]
MTGGRALPGPFRVTEAAVACVSAATGAAARLLEARGLPAGPVSVDARHAEESFRSERHLLVDGRSPGEVWAPLSGDYRTADGWVRLHCNYPHHADAVRRAVGGQERADVVERVLRLRADDVEAAVLAEGGAAAALRPPERWRAHPQGRAVAAEPLVAVEKVGDAPARPLPRADRPLAGVRVLDLTHVIAGPVCGRVLSAHGADVLHVGAAHLPVVAPLVVDTGFGKRSTFLDLRAEEERATLRALLAEGDVLVQSYRPGSLAAKGFGERDLPPGSVLVSLDAYGHTGPWRDRRGFDSLVQMASGIAAESGVDTPRPLPAQALDHGTGWLAALGVMRALAWRAAEGGTWHVKVSLARTAWWLSDLGRTDAVARESSAAPYLSEMDSDFGRVTHVRPPGRLPGSPPRWESGPRKPGADAPNWL